MHPKVAAVVTHCGWGGTLECISGGPSAMPRTPQVIAFALARFKCTRMRMRMHLVGTCGHGHHGNSEQVWYAVVGMATMAVQTRCDTQY